MCTYAWVLGLAAGGGGLFNAYIWWRCSRRTARKVQADPLMFWYSHADYQNGSKSEAHEGWSKL